MAPRPTNRLSARTVATKKEPGLHADGAGLYLEVDREVMGGDGRPAPQLKRWVYLFQFEGRRKQMGLGALTDVSLAEARAARDAARAVVRSGRNPIEARKDERAPERAATFGDIAQAVLKTLQAELTNPKHHGQWKRSLEVHAADLTDKPVARITTEDVLAALRPIWEETPESASRTRGRIERVLDAAKATGLRQGENPARWRGHLSLLLPKKPRIAARHHPALPFAKAPDFMACLRGRPATAARALEFTILTAARTGETRGAVWREIDWAAKVWTVPAERMKAKVEHRVPLSEAALVILRAAHAASKELDEKRVAPDAPVFLSPTLKGPLSNMAMDMLLRRLNSEITVHGFRSTFRDWAGETTDFPREIVEAALAHQVGNKVELAYRRGDALEKRRRLMEAWASYCATRQVVKDMERA